jgi:hypothetical protein
MGVRDVSGAVVTAARWAWLANVSSAGKGSDCIDVPPLGRVPDGGFAGIGW